MLIGAEVLITFRPGQDERAFASGILRGTVLGFGVDALFGQELITLYDLTREETTNVYLSHVQSITLLTPAPRESIADAVFDGR